MHLIYYKTKSVFLESKIISIFLALDIKNMIYLCNIIGSFWIKRELGEKPKQSRCCELRQRNKHFIFCH